MMNRRHWISGMLASRACLAVAPSEVAVADESPPAPNAERDERQQQIESQLSDIEAAEVAKWQKELDALPSIDATKPESIDRLSRRGDLRFFLRQFEDAVADYEAMEQLDRTIAASHWRLGIARYYAGQFEQAAAVFDRYHSFDNVDRENGIWRYLAHRSAFGREAARQQLLKYERDDRPPFREVYQLFDGSLDAAAVLASIPDTLPADARNSRRFYAHLYIGLSHHAEGDHQAARVALQEAVLNEWPKSAGFGPHWMWQVGRIELASLESPKASR
jgi:lipoprotein NlpI